MCFRYSLLTWQLWVEAETQGSNSDLTCHATRGSCFLSLASGAEVPLMLDLIYIIVADAVVSWRYVPTFDFVLRFFGSSSLSILH